MVYCLKPNPTTWSQLWFPCRNLWFRKRSYLVRLRLYLGSGLGSGLSVHTALLAITAMTLGMLTSSTHSPPTMPPSSSTDHHLCSFKPRCHRCHTFHGAQQRRRKSGNGPKRQLNVVWAPAKFFSHFFMFLFTNQFCFTFNLYQQYPPRETLRPNPKPHVMPPLRAPARRVCMTTGMTRRQATPNKDGNGGVRECWENDGFCGRGKEPCSGVHTSTLVRSSCHANGTPNPTQMAVTWPKRRLRRLGQQFYTTGNSGCRRWTTHTHP